MNFKVMVQSKSTLRQNLKAMLYASVFLLTIYMLGRKVVSLSHFSFIRSRLPIRNLISKNLLFALHSTMSNSDSSLNVAPLEVFRSNYLPPSYVTSDIHLTFKLSHGNSFR